MNERDWTLLTAWFAERGHDLDASAPYRFPEGLANLNYRVRFDGQDAVVRRPPPDPLAPGANDMAREWRVLSRLGPAYPLAPRALGYCDDRSVLGVDVQVIEYRRGITVGAHLPKDAPNEAPRRMTGALLDAMATLHELDPAAVGLQDLGRPDGFLDRQVASLGRRAEKVWPDGVPVAVERLRTRLADAVPGQDRTNLLHMDLKFDNVLLDPETYAASAVIDWDMTTRGSALFDLAVLLSYWIEPSDPADVHGLERVPSLEDGFPDRASVARQYFRRAGRPEVDMAWYVALARLRLAVLWMQLFRAWETGSLQGEHYARFADLALAIVDLAEHHYSEGTL